MAIEQKVTITPLEHSAGFGAAVRGVDLNNLDDATFKIIEEALYTYKVLVIKNQYNLLPKKQYEFNKRFDPEASGTHGHGTAKETMTKRFQGKRNLTAGLPGVPDEEMVRMVGRGEVEAGFHGLEEPLMLNSAGHAGFHKEPLTSEEMANGDTRFIRWHIDAQFYPKRNYTARVTTIWAHTLPKGPDLNLRFDNGSGHTMKVRPGLTAFMSSCKLYESLSDEQRKWVDHSLIEYAPSPYEWIINCKGRSDGFALVSEDKEVSFDDVPNADFAEAQTLPLVWPNPVTGEKALQFHAIIARRLHVKTSPDGPVRIVDDVREVRQMLDDLQKPFLRPENILISPQEEGDLAVWSNRLTRHSAIDLTDSYGHRRMLQCHLAASDDPSNPSPIEGLPTRSAIAV